MCFKGKIHAMEIHQVCSCEVQELEGYLCVVNEANLQQQQQHSLFSHTSWGTLEMKPERNKFKVQAH